MRKLAFILAVLLALSLCACTAQEMPSDQSDSFSSPEVQEPSEEELAAQKRAEALAFLQENDTEVPFSADMLDVLIRDFDEAAIDTVLRCKESKKMDEKTLWETFGVTSKALRLLTETTRENVHVKSQEKRELTLAFTGDVCLADDWYNMTFYQNRGYTPNDAFPGTLREKLTGADLLLINNEFCFSARGEKMPGKRFTFRAKPENAKILQAIGTDIVCLANNHCFDYGKDAFLDTLDTLKTAGIPYAGGGKDLEEAMMPQYFVIGGRVIAYACATRAEKTVLTPEAGENSPGVLRTYDSARFLTVIEEARKTADFVVAYVHWGAENETYLEQAIVTQAREYIDAGADAVVGSHAHRLQAVDYYDGKPIFYNLGNFYFNLETEDTALATLTLSENGEVQARMIPCVQSAAKVFEVSGTASGERILSTLRRLSQNVEIDEDGYFTPKTQKSA
ncbi:MAG: CapA family protein [Clostridia bacterium]|nr:CapA family protein [Clostridia bacterium]